MTFEPGTDKCRAKIGLLVLRHCGDMATGICSVCGTPVCAVHQVPGAKGLTCPDCAAQDPNAPESGSVFRSRRRREYYRDPYYSPFGRREGYFNDRDYSSVNRTAAAAAAGSALHRGGAGQADDYDALES